ncbi:energy transducer TonB [Fodinibius halophilus]|uniref:Energy transducer TonB n=1 Tax=Fodinibius halophilus TaxID=1736908 RepID=A0A6M1T5Z2_9BACT|nr:energy transducer TonB [Fodinibius halophilus]NGP87411.1 energy transducer TonB [Fodinibius halophilus]
MMSTYKNIKRQLGISIILGVALFLVGSLINPTTVNAQDDKVYTVVDKMPEIKGGLPALYKEIDYPKEARRKGISGRVYLQVIVDENGDVQDPKVLKGIGGGCGEAAIDAIKDVKFTPGQQGGKAVKVKYSLPVTFRIEN